jgi:YD repeat-containing protein
MGQAKTPCGRPGDRLPRDKSRDLPIEVRAQLHWDSYTAPPGLETTLVQDGPNWLLTYRDHTSKSFDTNGKLTAETDANGNTTSLAYASGRLTSITDAAGRSFGFGYDGNGRVTSISIPGTAIPAVFCSRRTALAGAEPGGFLPGPGG